MADEAILDGRKFLITEISGGFKIKTADTKTLGGKVVQVFGTGYEPLVVTGTFGTGGWEAQRVFFEEIKAYAKDTIANPRRGPSTLVYPAARWNFQVYLIGYSEAGSNRGVRLANTNIAPTWQLTFLIVNDGGFRKMATDAFIKRLGEGLGWKIDKFNANYALFGPGLPPGVMSDQSVARTDALGRSGF